MPANVELNPLQGLQWVKKASLFCLYRPLYSAPMILMVAAIAFVAPFLGTWTGWIFFTLLIFSIAFLHDPLHERKMRPIILFLSEREDRRLLILSISLYFPMVLLMEGVRFLQGSGFLLWSHVLAFITAVAFWVFFLPGFLLGPLFVAHNDMVFKLMPKALFEVLRQGRKAYSFLLALAFILFSLVMMFAPYLVLIGLGFLVICLMYSYDDVFPAVAYRIIEKDLEKQG